jgi:hypothetical protein
MAVVQRDPPGRLADQRRLPRDDRLDHPAIFGERVRHCAAILPDQLEPALGDGAFERVGLAAQEQCIAFVDDGVGQRDRAAAGAAHHAGDDDGAVIRADEGADRATHRACARRYFGLGIIVGDVERLAHRRRRRWRSRGIRR